MRKILSHLLSPIFLLTWGLLLLIFHPIQMICFKLGGYRAHKKSIDAMNFTLFYSFLILGVRIKIKGLEKLPEDRPLIIISNHQSLFDISPIGWIFRKHHPKFISKKELGKYLPSVSYNLKHGGSAIIDRSKGSQAIREIIKLGRFIEKNNYSTCIFPEGTRSKDGKVKKFQEAGIRTLLKTAPSSVIVPFVIDGHSRLLKHGLFPLLVGEKLSYTILDTIEPKGLETEDIVETTELLIKQALNQV